MGIRCRLWAQDTWPQLVTSADGAQWAEGSVARRNAREVTGDDGDRETDHVVRHADHWEDFSFYSEGSESLGLDLVYMLTG